MSNEDNDVINFRSVSLRGPESGFLTDTTVDLFQPHNDALSMLRGDPDQLAFLNILYDSLRSIELEVPGTVLADFRSNSTHSDQILSSLCTHLVHGSGVSGEADTSRGGGMHEDLPGGIQASQDNEDANIEGYDVFPSFLDWRKNIQLQLPLCPPQKKGYTFRLARQIAQEHVQHHAQWVSELLIPLYNRWQHEEQLQSLQAQQPSSQTQPTSCENKIEASHGMDPDKQSRRLKGARWMKALLNATTDCLVEQMLFCVAEGTADTPQGRPTAGDVAGTFGSLSMAACSYRTLCVGAMALLGCQWIELAKDVKRCFVGTTSTATVPSEPPISAGSSSGGAMVVEAKSPTAWLGQCAVVQHRAQQHALVLWGHWTEYFLKYGSTMREVEGKRGEQEGSEDLSAAKAFKDVGTPQPTSNPKAPTAVAMTESQWLFLLCLVLYTENLLRGKGNAAEEQGIVFWNGDTGSPVVLTSIMTHAVRCFTRKLVATLLAFASMQLDLCVHKNTTSIDLPAPYLPFCNRTIARDFFWKCIQQSEAQATQCAQGNTLCTHFWSSLLSIYSQLTAMEKPNEEAFVTSLATAGNSNKSSGDNGRFVLEDVLHSIEEAYRRCSEHALRETADYFAEITKNTLDGETYTRIGTKRQRDESPTRETRTCCVASSAEVSPDAKLNNYLIRVFYPAYHSTCYLLLRPERQRQLSALLCELHRLLVDPLHENVSLWERRLSKNTHPPSAGPMNCRTPNGDGRGIQQDTRDFEPTMEAYPKDQIIPIKQLMARQVWVACRLLTRDARLILMLNHAVLTLLERHGRVAEEEESVLTTALIPTLVALSVGGGNGISRSHLNPRTPEAHDVSEPSYSTDCWSRATQAAFCLYTLIHSEFMALPWSVEGIYLSLARHRGLTRYLLNGYWDHPEACVAQLEEWIKEGGGAVVRQPGTSIGKLCDSLDNDNILHDPALQQLKNRASIAAQQRQGDKSITISSIVDECTRRVTPLLAPSPCGAFLVLAFSRTLSQKLYALRNVYEAQRRLAEGDDALEYLGRCCIFCTAEDIEVFKVIVRTAHRMVFSAQHQPVGLLQFWVSMLAHLFAYVVPQAESEEGMELMPRSWQLRETVVNCFAEKALRTGWRALRPSVRGSTSSQTALRVALGELLAELFLMPVSDSNASLDCPHAFPVSLRPPGWQQEQLESQAEVQRTLPHAVLEGLCLLLRVNTNVSAEELAQLFNTVATEATGGSATSLGSATADASFGGTSKIKGLEDDNFLGLAGLIAFCRQVEKEVVPGSLKDTRLAHLLRCLWAVADLSALG